MPTSTVATVVVCVVSMIFSVDGKSNSAIVVNQLTAWSECSLYDSNTEWSICLGPTDDRNGLRFHYWYCPTVEEFSDANFQDVHDGPMTCMTCPGAGSAFGTDCKSAISNISSFYNVSRSDHHTDESVQYCVEMCESGIAGEECSNDAPCNSGYFCDFSWTSNTLGICKTCPFNMSTCFDQDFASSLLGQKECFNCQLACADLSNASVLVDGAYLSSNKPISNAIQPSRMFASGPLTECSNLILKDVHTCPGENNHVCLVEDLTGDIILWDLSQKAEANGCIAILMLDSGVSWGGQDSNGKLNIPFVFVSDEEEKRLLKKNIGEVVHVEIQVFGSACVPSWDIYGTGDVCTESLPCPSENEYCNYQKTVQDGKYIGGWCSRCPMTENGDSDPSGCFFDRSLKSNVKGLEQVESCATSCMASLLFRDCKFCPDDITAFDFGVENTEDKCHFCPNQEVLYPDRLVPLFGPNVTCLNMQAFFNQLEVHKDSQNCKLALKSNYICGCEGPGYAGANSRIKKSALAWLPRVCAIISLMGSSFIIYDTSKTVMKRSKLLNQLLTTLSFFDMLGSVAYMFTTLPIPASYFIYEGRGNDGTCVAQGFFIQLGTVAGYMNVSLASYYLLRIKYGWSELKLASKRVYLFVPPILVGLSFAFAGIPYYGNMMIWCNNTAEFWPEFPLILAIAAATCIMSGLCCHVYRQERRTMQFTGGSTRFSGMVFEQACWFLAAFYFTWLPYLMLQYLWASGKAFYSYGLILYASTSIPLQGFWNWIVYTRPRYLRRERRRRSTLSDRRNVLSDRKKNLAPQLSSESQTISNTDHKKSRLDAGNLATADDVVDNEHLEPTSNATPIDLLAHLSQAQRSSVD
ncbi:hypothetical protein HJC23_005109 [Cyclotella cryptica]|uniref:G-protein coupled receptors family 1 profile domain-containing protein n=1 Tax=Cyclotella cryptica TaxID=29204 RepID=A0ABD3QFG2_9STRA|eukprot:CCRYP_005792-RA/>CCRYP_005792-RA protein AED:0.01 eAED:0.01 QI:80/1/0.8/1/0.5/0.4/5/3960/861